MHGCNHCIVGNSAKTKSAKQTTKNKKEYRQCTAQLRNGFPFCSFLSLSLCACALSLSWFGILSLATCLPGHAQPKMSPASVCSPSVSVAGSWTAARFGCFFFEPAFFAFGLALRPWFVMLPSRPSSDSEANAYASFAAAASADLLRAELETAAEYNAEDRGVGRDR